MPGKIVIKGPFPPPTGLVGPFARTTESHVYQLYDATGRKLMSGSGGADQAALIARVQGYAAEKGLLDVTVEILPAA